VVGQDGSSWRVGFDVSTSRGLSGGHPETEGVTPEGRVVEVTPHAHTVDLDLTRYEFSLSRTFDETWDSVLRVPYFIKEQTAGVVFPQGGSAEDRGAAHRSGRNHHRSATYQGFSDFELGLGWRKKDVLGEDSVVRLSFGLALPVGETQPDPLVAGDRGVEHLHIQFGNGTFDPLLDVYVGIPLAEKWAFSLYSKARIPLYENGHDYRGSIESMVLPRVTYLPTAAFSLAGGIAANYYGYAEWDGRRDPNSGQFSLSASFSAGYKFSEHLTGSLGVILPLLTESFSGDDALDPSPTFSLSMAWTF
jgi:hypothetical protein